MMDGWRPWPTNARSASWPPGCPTSRTDISRYEACEEAIAHARSQFGGPHILINNGAMGMGVIRRDHMVELIGIQEITPGMWDQFTATNYSGAWYMTRAAIDGMLANGWGRIVNVTTSFFTMLRSRFHPYGPAKAGLEAISAGHAEEFAGTGVTVQRCRARRPHGHADGARGIRLRPGRADRAVRHGAGPSSGFARKPATMPPAIATLLPTGIRRASRTPRRRPAGRRSRGRILRTIRSGPVVSRRHDADAYGD